MNDRTNAQYRKLEKTRNRPREYSLYIQKGPDINRIIVSGDKGYLEDRGKEYQRLNLCTGWYVA